MKPFRSPLFGKGDRADDLSKLQYWVKRLQDLPLSKRQSALSRLAKRSPELAAAVSEFIEQQDTIVSPSPMAPVDPVISNMIDAYRIIRLIGEGGMGAVYLAERLDEINMLVALKLIRVATPGLLRRFHRERQILASLQHPGIARLYDGGTTADGTPYFVMEYVDGAQINHYVRQHKLDLRQRLKLFVAVCEAVSYAHRNLVIHRDIKPGNILVGRDGQPRLVDFGIAAPADDGGETAQTMFAATPAYASPEQLCGARLTAASDEYSLGLVLQELITGQPVFDGRFRGPQSEPDPSPELMARIPLELRWILQRTLAPEPERRYGNVSELAADVQRHLDGLPVLARPPSRRYLLRKFIERHRLAAAMVATLSLALLVTTALAVHAMLQESRASGRAQLAAAREHVVNDFLVKLLQSPDPSVQGRDVRVIDLIDQALASARSDLANQPRAQAQVLSTLGGSLAGLGETERGIAVMQEARSTMLSYESARSHEVLEIDGDILSNRIALQPTADLAKQLGKLKLRCVLLFGEADAACLTLGNNLGTTYALLYRQGQHEFAGKAERLLAANLALRAKLLGEDDPSVTRSRNNYASLLMETGRIDEAAKLVSANIEIQKRVYGPDSYYTLTSESNLAACLEREGRYAESLAMMQALIPPLDKILGPDHPEQLRSRLAVARLQHKLGQDSAAADAAREILRLAGDRPEAGKSRSDAEQLLRQLKQG